MSRSPQYQDFVVRCVEPCKISPCTVARPAPALLFARRKIGAFGGKCSSNSSRRRGRRSAVVPLVVTLLNQFPLTLSPNLMSEIYKSKLSLTSTLKVEDTGIDLTMGTKVA